MLGLTYEETCELPYIQLLRACTYIDRRNDDIDKASKK